MKKFSLGVVVGLLIGLLVFGAFAVAGNPVALIINGKTIDCGDTPPQIINGRTYVPARFVAEPLGASVVWNADKNAVEITAKEYGGTPTDLEPKTSSTGQSATGTASTTEGFIYGKELHDKYGITMCVPDPKQKVYQLSKGEQIINIDFSECKEIDGKYYFPISRVSSLMD